MTPDHHTAIVMLIPVASALICAAAWAACRIPRRRPPEAPQQLAVTPDREPRALEVIPEAVLVRIPVTSGRKAIGR